MTRNQLQALELQETKRHNAYLEGETTKKREGEIALRGAELVEKALADAGKVLTNVKNNSTANVITGARRVLK